MIGFLLATLHAARADATLVFNEIMYHPATNELAMEWVELYNQLAVDLDVSGWRLAGDIGYTFPAGTRVRGRGFVLVALDSTALMAATTATNVLGPFTNRLSNGGGTLRLHNNNDRIMDAVNYETEGEWPVAPDGAGPSLAKRDEDMGSAHPASWHASRRIGGTPGTSNQLPATFSTTTRTLLPLNQSWRYDQSGANLGTGWKEFTYADSGWPSGLGVLAREDNPVITPLTNTVLSLTNLFGQRIITYYFRTHFTSTNVPAAISLNAANLIDDGVVVYLNGSEVYRYRVPPGQNYQTLATNQANEGVFETIAFPGTALRQGDNVLAAEVHQVNDGSTDVAFGLRLDEVATNTPPDIAAVLPVAFNEISAVTNAQFWVELVNLGTQSVSLGSCVLTRLGSPTNHDYVLPPQTLLAGGHVVLDRATLGFGADPGDRVVLYGPGKAAVLDAVVAKSYPRARLPEGNGAWLYPNEPTPGATNRFALHSEIVINEIMYRHKPFPSVNGLPAADNREEWIELYNRSPNAVDLSGWELDDGIRYKFASDKILAPGAYVVVAKDATVLRAAYPAIDIVGNYSGKLSAKGERLLLKDPTGNPADEVRFYSGGRWAGRANGGGSSLELRDAYADNTKAEAWAGSEESGKSSWQTFSYRMTAQSSLAAGSDSPWREFLLGLLGEGECLVDDLRVVQSPTNNPVSLISNGNFEGGQAGWRVLGTHGTSQVIPEPGNPGNHVLRVVVTGPQEHMHNHIETTLSGGRSVVNGELYEISYRAKWVAGNRLLNTRLWFNRVARTMELAAPQNNGTPGARNSRFETNLGPTFAQLQHQPVVPAAGASGTVSVSAEDPQSVTNLQLFWSAAGGGFSSVSMTLQSGGVYRGTIPGYAAGTVVQFYVRALDGLGAAAMFPERGPGGGAFYKVNDGQANVALQHNFRIITTPANAALLHADTNVMSNDELPCTVIYDERLATYEVGVRLKASMNGRPYSDRVGFHLSFPPDEPFRGVHPAMGLDRRAGDNSPKGEEIVVRHVALAAGGVPTMHLDVANVLSPRGTENGPALLTPSYEDDFIETAFENGGDGILHEMEGPYVATTANAAGYKLPQPNNSGNYVDLANWGDDKETYRYHFIRKNHHGGDDFAPLIALSKAFSLSGTALETQTRQLMDLDEWLRAYAVITLCGVNDTYTFWLQHNVMFFFRPADHKAVYLMWDNDFSFSRSATDVIVGNQNLGKIINLPSNLRVLYAQMLDIMDTTYNTNYLAYWLAHYAPLSGTIYNRLSYIQQRSDYVKSVIAGAGGNTPFSVSATNLSVTGSNVVTLSGSAPVRVKTITVNGVAWPVTWSSLTGWTLRVPVSAATNSLQVAGLDLHGNLVTNTSFTVTAVVNVVPASPVGQLVFNEIMFHAARPDGEYVEIYNRSTNTTYDLSGWRVNGLDYTFPPGSFLAPRSYLVLAKNRSAFATAYDNGVSVFGEFGGELQLDGETLTLIQPGLTPAEEVVVDRVRYEGALLWPAAAAAGTGSSYQLIDASQDNSRAGNWTARYAPPAKYLTPGMTNQMTASLPAFPALWINEVQADHSGGLLDNANQPDPWIEIYNSGSNSVSLNGLYLSGNYTNLTNWAFPSGYSLGPTQFLVVFCDGQPAQSTGNQLHTSFRLPPASGSVALSRLYNSQPQVLDYVNYAGLNSSNAYGSFPDGQPFDRQEFFYVTPGGTNDGRSAPLRVCINEWMAANSRTLADADRDYEDWFELFNPGTNAVDLAGYYLTDTLINRFKYLVTTNGPHLIPPRGYLLVWADEETGQNVVNGVPHTDLHVNFKLAAGGEEIGLFAADGTPVDAVTFSQQTTDVSMGRDPDGSANIVFMPGSASPRAANYLRTANTAPTLNPIGGRVIFLGQKLAFTASASDADTPPQTFTFALDPVAPPGAVITGAGAFTWTPTVAGTFPTTVRVTDSGQPPLSATETIAVEVLPPPAFGSWAQNGQSLELNWATHAGQTYAVDYKDHLDAPLWTPLWTNIATGPFLSFTNSTTNARQRFLRIRAGVRAPGSP